MSQSEETLTRIAEVLGLPVETFSRTHAVPDLDMLGELIALWIAIGRGTDRTKVLAYARAIVAVQDKGSSRA